MSTSKRSVPLFQRMATSSPRSCPAAHLQSQHKGLGLTRPMQIRAHMAARTVRPKRCVRTQSEEPLKIKSPLHKHSTLPQSFPLEINSLKTLSQTRQNAMRKSSYCTALEQSKTASEALQAQLQTHGENRPISSQIVTVIATSFTGNPLPGQCHMDHLEYVAPPPPTLCPFLQTITSTAQLCSNFTSILPAGSVRSPINLKLQPSSTKSL